MERKQWEKAVTLRVIERRGRSHKTKCAQTQGLDQLKNWYQDEQCLLGQEAFVVQPIEGF